MARVADRLSHLRGAAMKLGQLLSLEGDDLLPPEFAEALAVLRATADTMPASQVRRVLVRKGPADVVMATDVVYPDGAVGQSEALL